MAWASLNTLGGGGFKASQTTVTLTLAAQAEVGNVIVVVIGLDNTTADATDLAANVPIVTGVVAGTNVFRRIAEHTTGNGAADGATTSLWVCQVSQQIAAAGTIVATFRTARGAGAITAWEFSKDAATVIANAWVNRNAGAASAMLSTSLNVTTPNAEHLRFRAGAGEEEVTTAGTKTAAFTALIGVTGTSGTGGVATSNIILRGEYLISTSTGQASLPTGMPTSDWASVYVALSEENSHPNGWDFIQTDCLIACRKTAVASIALAAAGCFLPPTQPPELPPVKSFISTHTSVLLQRPLYYQTIARPVFIPPVVAVPRGWEPDTNERATRRSGAPISTIAASGPVFTLIPAVQQFGVVPVVTGSVFSKPLYYQAYTRGYAPVVAAQPSAITWQQAPDLLLPRRGYGFSYLTAPLSPPVSVAFYGWRQPLSTAPTRETLRADQLVAPYALFAPNTVTIDKWQQPLGRAVPPTKLWHSDIPYYNLAVIIDNTVTVDKWQFNWSGPPRYWPPQIPASPFIPPEATAENTVDISKWQQPLSTAVPHGWPPYAPVTVPYFSYLAGDNTGTAATWFSWWGGPPRFWPPKPMALPFWPKEATSENTVTSDKWLVDLSRPARRTRSLPAQYQFPFTAFAQFTVAWQQPLSAPIVKPRRVSQQTVASYPTPPFFPNTVTIDKWQQPLGRATPAVRLNLTNIIYARLQPAILANTVTIDKWQQPLSRSVVIKKPVFTAPLVYRPQVIPVEAPQFLAQVITQINFSRPLYYQAITKIAVLPPEIVVPPVVGKGWTLESPGGQVWTLEQPAICGTDEEAAFQEDTFQGDTFQVGAFEAECWTVELPPVNTWEEEEPDP